MISTRYARASALAAVSAFLCTALSQVATAQNEATTPPIARESAVPTGAPIEDAKIEKFADAYIAVQDIQSKASQKMEATSDPAQAQQVKASAETEMIQAVKQTGLQVEEFNQIVQTMASNVDLRTRVTAKIQERTRG